MQTRFGTEGNCFAACLATVMGFTLDDVPELFADTPAEMADRARKWLHSVGWDIWPIPIGAWPEYSDFLCPDHTVVLQGPSNLGPGWGHCVVFRNGEIVHNPDPNGSRPPLFDTLWLVFPLNTPAGRRALEDEHDRE